MTVTEDSLVRQWIPSSAACRRARPHESISLQAAVDGESARGGSFGSFSFRGPARRYGPKELRRPFASFAGPPARASLDRALERGGLRSARIFCRVISSG